MAVLPFWCGAPSGRHILRYGWLDLGRAGLPEKGFGAPDGASLLVVALPGVQRFIKEARSTSDVAAGSGIYVALAARVAAALRAPGRELVFPSALAGDDGMPNRIVALIPPMVAEKLGGTDSPINAAIRAVQDAWQEWLGSLGLAGTDAAETSGFPVVQWVCVPAGDGGYPEQWTRAQRLLAARRRVHDFGWVEWRNRSLCALTARWPALEEAPPKIPRHEKDSALSTVGWVKRRWRFINNNQAGFPSTSSIASAPYRLAVLEQFGDDEVHAAVGALRAAAGQIRAKNPGMAGPETPVAGLAASRAAASAPDPDLAQWLVRSGGPWVYADAWQAESLAREGKTQVSDIKEAADTGYQAARLLGARMKQLKAPGLAAYLAVIVQDLDSMGKFLSGAAPNMAGERIEVTAERHRLVSATLQELAGTQRWFLEQTELLGVPVYLGGDDLLAFAPASAALQAAQACHDAVPPSLPSASTAVLFIHYHSGLQAALTSAHALLDQAKDRIRGKHGLAVGYQRRSGASAASVQPWGEGGAAVEAFSIFSAGQGPRLSPRLLADLDRDAGELASLSVRPGPRYRQELARLVRRHAERDALITAGGAGKIAGALEQLGRNEASADLEDKCPGSWPQLAARVGVFLRQEAR